MSKGQHTPGPWRWEFNKKHKSVNLVGGVPEFDKTVMQFSRWGMNGATPLFNAKIAGNLWNIMERPCDVQDWVIPFAGREHHSSWCADVVHPDARLIAAAPELLEALENAVDYIHDPIVWADKARAAIAKARGEA